MQIGKFILLLQKIDMKFKILLEDIDIKENRPSTRIRSVFSLRNGIFSNIERLKLKYPDSTIFFKHPIAEYEKSISIIENISAYSEKQINKFDLHITSENLSVLKMLNDIQNNIESDLELLDLNLYKNYNGEIIGSKKDIFVHKNAKILPGCIIDSSNGLVIIDDGATISPFSFISGPIYIGKNSKIDALKISGACICGHQTRLGGEIENSIINDFSNKHHEGYIGHSFLGSWVNIGAMATTSDLKNNYGIVNIDVPNKFYPINDFQLVTLSTSNIKFGSIIADCVKIAIGTMINTGSVFDFGCNVFDGTLKYMPPLSWGKNGIKYDKKRFISDSITIFKRRTQVPHQELINMIDKLY